MIKTKSRAIKINKNGSGQKLWKEAKKIIPGGNMFLSKKSEMYLPNLWPSYFKSAKGCYVKDLDNKSYADMTMGIGTNILGYSNSFVNKAVINAIKNSSMSTLNAEEEVMLAKKLLKIHKWAGGVKFARTVIDTNPLKEIVIKEVLPGTKINTDNELRDYCKRTVKTNWHPVGTCKMGLETDKFAVLDSKLRVHGLKNLRVFDVSMMPSLVSANTNAPAMAIADRATDMMLN